MQETRSSVRVWCYSLPPSLFRRPSSAACSCSTLAQLLRNSCSCSTDTLAQHSRNSRATLAQLSRNSRATLALLLHRLGLGSGCADTEHLSAPASSQLPASAPPRHVLSRHRCAAPVVLTSIRRRCSADSLARWPPRRARCRSPCRSSPAGYSRGNQTQNPVGKIKKVVVIQLAVL